MQSGPTVSEAAAKMFRLFQVLYSVALRYVEFRASSPQAGRMGASAEMDVCLSALGFPSSGQDSQQGQHVNDFNQAFGQSASDGGMGDGVDAQLAQNHMMWMGRGAQLDDWFYNNSQMMGLLEEPSFNFPDQD